MDTQVTSAPDAIEPKMEKFSKKKVPQIKFGDKSRASKFADWNVGDKYKLEKFLGEGSYG